MKKIKYLLLGIVFLLGIGCSFGYAPYYIDYFTDNGGFTSYNLNSRIKNNFPFCVLGLNSRTYTTNLDDYFSWCNGTPYDDDYTNYSVYFDDNGNKLSYFFRGQALVNGQYSSTLVLSNNLASTQIGNTSNGSYSRILGNENCLGTGIFQTGNFCSSDFIELFTNNYYTISSLGNIYDSDYNGVHYYKGPVAPSVGLGYSFGFVDGSGWQVDGYRYYLNSGDKFYFRTITFSGSTIYPIDGPLIFRLNNTTNLSVGDSYKIIALGPTGDYQDFSFIYSIYNCSSSANSIFDCSFLEGGNIAENFDYDFTMSSSYNYPYTNLIYFLTKSSSFIKFNNSYSSTNNTLTLSSRLGNSLNDNTITLNLVPSATGFDIIDNIEDNSGGGGNQSTGSMAINTGLINLCLTSPSFYDLNTIFCNRVFGGRDLSYVQGLIGSGSYLQSYIDGSGNLVYVIDIVEEPGTLTGSVVWECYGDRCINSQSGSWGDVEPWEILHLSGGDILSSGYYLGFFESINETGYFFKCPYSYNDSRWVAGRSILNAIGRDPFLPINCFIAAYENGRRVKLFDEAFNGYSWGPLMSGDSQNHRNLFTFFDVLLSVALIFFLMKFYHLFK